MREYLYQTLIRTGKWRLIPVLLLLIGGLLILLFNHDTAPLAEELYVEEPEVIIYSEKSAFLPQHISPDQLRGKNSSGVTLLQYTPIIIQPGMRIVEKHDALLGLAQQPQAVCHQWRMYGGGNNIDGGWPVCLSPKLQPKSPCVVYSYGINYDWSFDDTYHAKHQCTLRTFDPSMGRTQEHQHSKDVFFYPLGLSDKEETTDNGWKMHSHKQLLQRFKETNVTISYLKFDIESSEFKVLHNMIKDGVLKNVMQLSFEIHMKLPIYEAGADANVEDMFDAVKGLEALGFRRWFYHHRLNGFPFQCDQSFININYL